LDHLPLVPSAIIAVAVHHAGKYNRDDGITYRFEGSQVQYVITSKDSLVRKVRNGNILIVM